ncbi:putative iron ascorbate-dependent oxidoreductase family protein [Teratosphaeria destructans]|uniref:Iron ascorbate-dependent oxidoreductase family protein n=1 Tax=Teratosphaeria destructans TaxID=418781 RepID=A0A9W7SSC5_9PEZI|nr:putative iron ascorbate-dependent oxidoreductase family protein [Teratosphaeria destructans]
MNNEDIRPPQEPPPLLAPQQIQHLAHQGWLAVDLKPQLVAELQKLSQASAAFFDRHGSEKKAMYAPGHGTEKGFYHVEGEKQYVTLRHLVCPESQLERHAKEVWRQAANFLHRILCDMSRAAGYDYRGWDHLVRASLGMPQDARDMQDVLTLMRLFRYYPTAGIAEQHVDIGLLTLCVGSGKGLQVLDWTDEKNPRWIDAIGPTVLVGDMARALMRNQFRAGMHRVVSNPAGRSSIIFALRPCVKEPTDLTRFGGKGTVDTREFFFKIKKSKYNINATHDIRQQQRQAQREKKRIANDGVTASAPG